VRSFAGPEIHAIVGDTLAILQQIGDRTVDVVFCSNFLEHLPDKEQVWAVLRESARVLADGGRLIVLQPNIRFAYREYWDFFDHFVPLSDRSLREAVEAQGLQVVTLKPRFLPFTTVTRLPQPAWLLHVYLSLPPLQWWFGKQLLLVAEKHS
jgi:ubiquinone/menaquinone biosynthesis C-methylase UbiE